MICWSIDVVSVIDVVITNNIIGTILVVVVVGTIHVHVYVDVSYRCVYGFKYF